MSDLDASTTMVENRAVAEQVHAATPPGQSGPAVSPGLSVKPTQALAAGGPLEISGKPFPSGFGCRIFQMGAAIVAPTAAGSLGLLNHADADH